MTHVKVYCSSGGRAWKAILMLSEVVVKMHATRVGAREL